MNRTITSQLIVWLTLLLFSSNVRAQELSQNVNKEIKLVYGDSIVVTEVRRQEAKGLKLEPFKRYYWYTKGLIKSNIGDYHGSLLNGKYEVLMKSQLIVSGAFKNGLRNGTWKYWNLEGMYQAITTWEEGIQVGEEKLFYENGTLEAVHKYKEGHKEGAYKKYNKKGNLLEEGKLVAGKKQGSVKIYENGVKRIEKYKKGELIEPKPPRVKKKKENKEREEGKQRKSLKNWWKEKKDNSQKENQQTKQKKSISLKNIFKKKETE